ncbi:TonB-dependent receptor [Fulvitalea axinellae]|uniref:TonB-dependent receptor n=1 Tax=Fulvitalea axinellae TaxID=1182444 RepID=A0AAU9D1N1_9BACT|nr:TonB-dependent receptor [Fulvitalea axinellae]
MKKLYALYVLLFVATISQGLANGLVGTVRGTVKSDKESLPYVNITLASTQKGTATDVEGKYALDLPPGTHTLTFTAVGFRTTKKTITVDAGQTVDLNVRLREDMIQMDGVVVSATRQEVSRKDAPAVVNVISPQLFENTQSVVLADGLNYVPGLRVENDCQNCGFMQLRMNGLEGPYTQILIDSRPIFSGMNAVYGLEQLPTSMLERVEVVRGGGSVLFGSNAIGGTVNIITKEPTRNYFSVSNNTALVDGDALDNTINFNGSLVTEDRRAGIFMFGMHRKRNEWNANPDDVWFDADGNAHKDDFSEIPFLENNSLGFRAFYKTSEYSKLSAELHTVKEFRRGGNKFDERPDLSDITEQLDHDIIGGGLDFEITDADLKHRFNIYASGQDTRRKSYYGAEQDPSAYGKSENGTWLSGIQYNYDFERLFFAPMTLTAGSEYQYASLTDQKLGYRNPEDGTIVDGFVITDQETYTSGTFLQGEWKTDRVKFLLGARYDRVNIKDNKGESDDYTVNAFNPRVNLLVDITNKIQARASYATGFRAPQMFDEDLHVNIAGAEGVRHILADDLTEETSDSYTLSFDYTADNGNWQTYFLIESFYTRLVDPFRNTITEDQQGNTIFLKENADNNAVVKGINAEAKVSPLPTLSFQAGFTIQSSEYDEAEEWHSVEENGETVSLTSKEILRTPDLYGSFTVAYNVTDPFSVSLNGVYTGPMYVPHIEGGYSNGEEITEPELFKTGSFFDLGIKFAYDWDLGKSLCIQANCGVQNILNSFQDDFDAGVSRDSGFIYGPTRPQTFFMGIKISSL